MLICMLICMLHAAREGARLEEEARGVARLQLYEDQRLLRMQGVANRCVAVCCTVLHCLAVCCRVLQCVAVSCSVLQRVAV